MTQQHHHLSFLFSLRLPFFFSPFSLFLKKTENNESNSTLKERWNQEEKKEKEEEEEEEGMKCSMGT